MRLQGALDNDVLVATRKFLENGVPPDLESLWTAFQRSNSSLKRKPKKVLQASIERVLDFLGVSEAPPAQASDDSEAEAERVQQREHASAAQETMNRSLRANLSTPRESGAPSGSPAQGGEAADSDAPKRRRMANGEPLPKRPKSEKPSNETPTDVSLHDLGGMDDVLDQMEALIVRPLLAPEAYASMRVKVPKGILLHGPPGCGKTMISRAFAATMGLPFVEMLGPSIVSGMSGESEKGIRERFEEARKCAPCLLFMDEIDAIAPKRDSSQSQMEKRIVAQLLVSMDELDRDPTKPVIVLATTNRPDSIDPALRRGGRFDTEINIPVPNEQVREQILKAQTRESPMSDDVDFRKLAKMTAGFVGSDLHDLVSKAGSWQLNRYFEAVKAQPLNQETMDIDLPP
ncbi:AAA-domain-containing protein, partial [Hortaea werneckii]